MEESSLPERSLLVRIFYSPSERRLRAGWRLAFQSFFWLLATFLFVLPVFALTGFPGLATSEGLIVSSLLTAIPGTISVYIARRWLDRRSFISLGLTWGLEAGKDLLFGIGLSGLLLGLVYIVETALGWLHFVSFAWEGETLSSVVQGLLVMLAAYLLTGWGEELLARGYWLQNLSDGLGLSWGAVISSVVFALAHLGNPNVSLAGILGLVAAGLFFAYSYVRTRCLWLPIGLHIGWNFFEGPVFGYPVSGLDSFHLIRQQVKGPSLWTGGAFGPEGGLLILPCLALGAFLVAWYTRAHNRALEN